jgi:hypothetical protein
VTSDDPEGEALDREIAHDKLDVKTRRKRLILFVPPLIALGVAAWALAASRPRSVLGARAIVGPKPPVNIPLYARVQLFRATPGIENASVVSDAELRVMSDGARGRIDRTDDQGIAELVVDQPVPPSVTIEARDGERWRPVGTIAIASLPEPDPRAGVLAVRRHGGAVTGDLRVEVGAELGALAPPLRGAAWVRVTQKGLAVPQAIVTTQVDGGVTGEVAPAKTDAGGLARIPLLPIASPVALTITAELGGNRGTWSGIVGSIQGAPVPKGDGRLRTGSKQLDLVAPSSHSSAYIDLWQSGVRIGGGKIALSGGFGSFPLPTGLSGVIDVETSSGPLPASEEDLGHAATWPLVLATDDVDAWGAVSTSPRFPSPLRPAGTLADYGTAVAATIAFAPPSIPPRAIVSDGLPAELKREADRGRTVRSAATAAVIGGGLLELGLMLWLGVFRSPVTVADAMRELGEEAPKEPPSRKWVGLLLAGIGIIALLFAAMATMTQGMP